MPVGPSFRTSGHFAVGAGFAAGGGGGARRPPLGRSCGGGPFPFDGGMGPVGSAGAVVCAFASVFPGALEGSDSISQGALLPMSWAGCELLALRLRCSFLLAWDGPMSLSLLHV